MRYAMRLCSATHPDSECASDAAKKYIRLGASPRAGQALISAAKVKALMRGRFNVAYNDINELALPVLRHRIKLNFEAIAERVSPDEIIKMILAQLSGKRPAAQNAKTQPAAEQNAPAEAAEAQTAEETPAETSAADKKKKRLFGKK